MKRIIKVTEQQLKETEGAAFEYLDLNNDVPYGNNSEINATGKLNATEYGEPTIGDKISDTMTNQLRNRFYGYYNSRPTTIREKDENNDNVDDFYNNDELDTLSDGNENNNLIKMPQSAEAKLNQLVHQLENLNSKQQAMILNKLIEIMDIETIPYSWTKELMLKLSAKNNVSK